MPAEQRLCAALRRALLLPSRSSSSSTTATAAAAAAAGAERAPGFLVLVGAPPRAAGVDRALRQALRSLRRDDGAVFLEVRVSSTFQPTAEDLLRELALQLDASGLVTEEDISCDASLSQDALRLLAPPPPLPLPPSPQTDPRQQQQHSRLVARAVTQWVHFVCRRRPVLLVVEGIERYADTADVADRKQAVASILSDMVYEAPAAGRVVCVATANGFLVRRRLVFPFRFAHVCVCLTP